MVRPLPGQRSPGPEQPAAHQRPRHPVHEEIHGPHPLRLRTRRRHHGGAAQAGRAEARSPASPGGGNRMKFNVRQNGDVTILDLSGKITIGSGEEALRNTVQEILNSGVKKVVINMTGVTMIDSSGIGELVSAYTTATNRGTKLKLANLPAKVSDILTITQLITVFDVFDSEAEAVQSFA